MRRFAKILAVLGLPLTLWAADQGHPDKAAAGKQATCPISGKSVDPSVSTDYKGQKVQFCCKGCVSKFEAAPARYLPQVYRQLYPQRVQTHCPVMGGEVDSEVFVEHKGERVYFCCKGCDKKFVADPARYQAKIAERSTEQVHCPVSGGAIDPAVSLEENGKTVYFCCAGCVPKYKASPARHREALRPTAGLLAHGKTAKDDLVLCPICTEEGVLHTRGETRMLEHKGMNYAVCNEECAKAFQADPERHAKSLRDRTLAARSAAGPVYTCAMHPVVAASPGKCPLCDMKLEPARK